MLALLLGVAITGSICQAPAQPPVFRAEAYVVSLPITVSRRTWYGGTKPVTNLDAADLEIILENDVYVTIRLDPDPKTPGRYLLSFTPPDHLRDGKPRQVQLRIKKRYSIKVTMTLPPLAGGRAPKVPLLINELECRKGVVNFGPIRTEDRPDTGSDAPPVRVEVRLARVLSNGEAPD